MCSAYPARAAIRFDPSSSRRPSTPTMSTSTGPLILVPPETIYRDYLSCTETDTFNRRYAAVLAPYSINPTAAAAATTPVDVARLLYTAALEGAPAAFLQWHQGTRGRGAQIVLLHSVSSYVPRMGLTVSLQDNLFFVLKGDITCDIFD